MKKSKSFLFILFTATLVFFQVSLVSAAEPIDEVRNLIEQYYVDDVPAATLSKPTIKEITDQLDPYSMYMSKKEYDSFTNSINQELFGIGVYVEGDKQGVKIQQIIPKSPAELAGLQVGDIITSADGKNLQGESVQTAISYITGQVSTFVTITFIQSSTGQTLTKTIERKKISLPNVESTMLGGQIGYIQLHSFSTDAAKQLQTAIQSLKGAKGFILDLRDNGGGYVSAAQEVEGLFPHIKDAFQLKDRTRIPEIYKTIKQKTTFSAPVHILINKNSASASEMVSASVREQKGATLYGQNSFGKGSMQALITLSDQSVLKLTVARFFTPKGTAINGIGVKPNIVTKVGDELVASHRDQIIKRNSKDKKLRALSNVLAAKSFTVKLNTNMNTNTISSKDIHLIRLGGKEIQTKPKIINKKTIKITTKEALKTKQKYIILLHLQSKSKTNKTTKQGFYEEISVK